MAPQIRAMSDEIERGRRLPLAIFEAMKTAGIFGMAMPRSWGGPELDPLTQFRVIETLAMAEGSVGWCAMIGCDSGYMSAFIDQEVARAMYPDIQVATGAAATLTGKAVRVPGGYRVDGRFPFVSGCHHSAWIWVGCVVTEDGATRADADGVPETRQCFVKQSQCEILYNLVHHGVRGTGSNDILVRNGSVPEEHTFSFQDPGLIKRPGPPYAFPFMFAAKGPAGGFGIARHAINALIESAATKPARRYTVGDRPEPPRTVRDDVVRGGCPGTRRHAAHLRARVSFRRHGRLLGDPGQRRATVEGANRTLFHCQRLCDGDLCRSGATGLQGSRRICGLRERTA